MPNTASHLLHRPALLLAVGLSALALGACGSSDSDEPSSGNAAQEPPSTADAPGSAGAPPTADDQDAGRVRLTQCLRENGVDIPDNPGPNVQVDPDKLQAALAGPCKEFQAGAFGDAGGQDLQEFRDAFSKFAQCMRDNGADVPDLGPNDGPAQIHTLIDPNDPDVQAAQPKCQDRIQQGAGGGH